MARQRQRMSFPPGQLGSGVPCEPLSRRRSVMSDAMIMPVVVRPRPIWQLYTSAAPSGGAQARAASTAKSLVFGAFSSVTGTRR